MFLLPIGLIKHLYSSQMVHTLAQVLYVQLHCCKCSHSREWLTGLCGKIMSGFATSGKNIELYEINNIPQLLKLYGANRLPYLLGSLWFIMWFVMGHSAIVYLWLLLSALKHSANEGRHC